MSSGQDILKYLASKNLLPTELDIVSKNEQTKGNFSWCCCIL